jgi:cellulose synthase/poly-beta-1,6-N-acetylglucosamine synthase-like glycosyltransferase
MHEILLGLSITCFLFAAVFLFQLAVNCRRIAYLRDKQLPEATVDWPKVSVIAPARNEELEIERAVGSLLTQDYPNYELIVLNDRSTDGTGEILTRMQAENPQLRAFHLDDLPAGWLGKNFAMHFGAAQASGELLLFTDADVVMQPDTLRRAVHHLQSGEVDHLTMVPDLDMSSRWLDAFVVTFMIFFCAYIRPWKVDNSKSKAHVGIGAFNLIRTDVYDSIGTHEAIRMRPDDDLKLGKIVKLGGFKQAIVYGQDVISVRWYGSVSQMIQGLMKNAFSGADYRLELVVFATLSMLTFFIWPIAGIFVSSGVSRWLYLATMGCHMLLFIDTARHARVPAWLCVLFPIGVLLFIYIQWRATILTYVNRGIRWRGTHYSLSELKANKV